MFAARCEEYSTQVKTTILMMIMILLMTMMMMIMIFMMMMMMISTMTIMIFMVFLMMMMTKRRFFDEALTGSSAFSWQPIWGKTFLHEQLKIAAQEIILHRGASSFLTESQVISQLRTISAKKLFMVAVAIEKTNDSDKKEQQAKNCSQSTDL